MTTIELTIGGWFAGVVIKNFVDKARSILEGRFKLHGEVGEMLFNVEASLARIQALLDVAECRAIANHNFTNWLKMIKEIASEAEDLMDDFETKRIQKSLENKVSGVLSYLMNNLVLVDDDMYKLKALLARLDKIARDAGGFIDLLKLNDPEEPVIGFLPKIQPLFHGREKEKDKLMNIIFPNVEETEHSAPHRLQEETRGTASVRVVCIIGEAGVGKTALAQVIYNHPNVKEAFHHRGWVFLSHKFDSNDFFKNIVCSFVTNQHPYDSEVGMEPFQASSNSSEHDLSRIIQNKRFFLVLDNAKDNLQRQWKKLRAKLTGGAAGSIVLVTTRSEVIAGSEVITLGTMPADILSTILKHHAFGNIRIRTACLESIGDEISGKLHGLPLLAQVIGRLLRMKLDEEHWRNVSESEWWNNYEDYAINNPALPAVTITLEFLSDHLKKCLGYCSMFPSSYLFDKKKLAHMWMSDSMQQCHESVYETKEVQWIDELLNRSLIQSTVWKNKYTVNEKIKEIVSSITQTGCYTVEDSKRPRTNLHDFSHIAINKSDFNVSLGLREHIKARSILFFDGQRTTKMNTALATILPEPSAMRVLDLSCIETKMERPPDVIKMYSHLRYLDLSFTGITMFPASLCGLHHLQVLGMRGCRFENMPRAMNKLVNLRYLYAEVCTLSLIHSIGQLTNLQCLEEFAVSEMEGHMITELKNLNNLGGHLCISNLEKVTSMEEVSDIELSRKIYIQKLVLKWHQKSASSDSCMKTLSKLKPNGNLEDLEIHSYMGALFPEWITDDQHFSILRYIKFSNWKKLEKLPPLGQLSHLKILILQGLEQIQCIGEEFYGSYDWVFPSLEELTFCDMKNWQRWLVKSTQIFPQIKKIVIKNCERLSDLPEAVLKGSLKELELSECKEIFRTSPSCLEYLKTLKRLKVHNCLGVTINIPRHLLVSIEVLNLQNCDVCFQGGVEYIRSLRRFLTIDCHEVTEGKRRKNIFNAQSAFSSIEDLVS